MDQPLQSSASAAELLTDQFYQWEMRGRGWMVWEEPVVLEPPFRPFRGHFLPPEFGADDGLVEAGFGGIGEKLLRFLGKPAPPPAIPQREKEDEEPLPGRSSDRDSLIELQIALPPAYQPAEPVFEQFLFSLAYCRSAMSFEVIGSEAGIVAQMAVGTSDAQQVFPQLKAHFPEAVVTPVQEYLSRQWRASGDGHSEVREFGLSREFVLPLNVSRKLATDWLVAVCGALEYTGPGEIGVLQVMFQPVRNDWVKNIWRAVTTSDGQPFFEDAPEITTQAKQKLARPLYAVVARVAARSDTEARTWELVKGLGGALALFRNPDGNELQPLENDEYPKAAHESDLLNRCSRRSGMLLNSDELVSLAHLPTAAVRSRKLNRRIKRTKEPPAIATGEGVVLGENEHDGKVRPVTLKVEHRLRHLHVIGNSGTGKSTLLLNLICQDIYQKRGVAVLDPHGDLIDTILGYIPPERYDDVVLFDASDDEYPIGFNILSAHSDLERTLLASDLVEVFKRLSTTWGDQMRSVLGNAVLAFLENSRTGTLPELRRFLIEPAFRSEVLGTVKDPEVTYYWEHEFPLLKSSSMGPLLTRLDEFLRRKTIRYIVGQRENKLDFAKIMDEGQIFLARLPQGLIGEDNSYMLGSLLVSKFHQLAIARQQKEASARRPFFLYLDEFHHFVTPTLETILSGARKYGLGLTLAHQSVHQLQKADAVGTAVLSMAGARVCFRVGDEDARRLAEGFSYFTTSDIQNLENYEAICRIDRKENDFNFRTIQPPDLDENAARRCDYLRYCTRSKFGTPRQKVEEELAKSRYQPKRERVDPFTKRTAKPNDQPDTPRETKPPPVDESAPATPVPEKPPTVAMPPPPQPKPAPTKPPKVPELHSQGKGGAEHKRWQDFVRLIAQQRGWTSRVEESLGASGDADVLLNKDQVTICCEIALTTPEEYEVRSISKRLTAGLSHVVVLSPDLKHLTKIERLTRQELGLQVTECVCFLHPDQFAEWLDTLDASQVKGEEVVGEVRVKYSAKAMNKEEQAKRWDKIKSVFKRLLRPRSPEE